jgi:RNA polymerase sigma-70 factor (ECF subfamily)
MITTNETLLDRLRAEDAHEAWREFYSLYWSAILRFARKFGLSETQSRDVLQETMVTLMQVLPGFIYNQRKGRFRSFLLEIVRHRVIAVVRRSRRQAALSLDAGQLHEQIPDEGNGDSEAAARARWKESLMEDALARLREDSRLRDNTWAVFEAYVIEGAAANVVARRFAIGENVVYQIRARLLRRLRTDVERRLRDSGIVA